MVEPNGSFLEQRRAELLAGEQVVPIDYEELRERAGEALAQRPFDYAAGGAGSEETMRSNRTAFQRYRIVTRVLQDVSERDLGVELFGQEATAPLTLAPIGGQTKYHDEGELATARAAGNLGTPLAVSNYASKSIEEVAAANGNGPRFFQLYWPSDWEVAESVVRRAEAADYDAIYLTVDSPIAKWRHRNLRNAYSLSVDTPYAVLESDPVVQEQAEAAGRSPAEHVAESEGLEKDTSITWEDLDALREWMDLPIVLKGILSPADARKASEWGADGIVVSNHGGRQINGAVSALEQLPAVAEAVDNETTVLLDSGVRSGSDMFKALALGADVVQFGRPYIFGLAVAGSDGVSETVRNYLAELESIMGLSGRTSVDQIDRSAIAERSESSIEGGTD